MTKTTAARTHYLLRWHSTPQRSQCRCHPLGGVGVSTYGNAPIVDIEYTVPMWICGGSYSDTRNRTKVRGFPQSCLGPVVYGANTPGNVAPTMKTRTNTKHIHLGWQPLAEDGCCFPRVNTVRRTGCHGVVSFGFPP